MVQPRPDPRCGTAAPEAAAVDGVPLEALDAPEEEALERRSCTVGAAAHGQRLDKALAAWITEFSRGHLQSLIEGGHVQLDGRVQDHCAKRIAAGQRLDVDLVPTAESRAFRPEPMPLAIVHEDADLLVIDKPAGLVVHPAAGHWSGTLMNGLLAHHAGAASLPRAGIVHRLDKDTSGLMVVGKTLQAVTALVRAISRHEVDRRYLALAWGAVEPARQRIEAPIGRDLQSRIRMAVVAGGKPARTDVECVATLGGISAVRCRLHTGRTHQIRVHLASRGHPLVADRLYGGAAALGLERQALHAHSLSLAHPIDGRPLAFGSPMPADFALAWHRLHIDA